MLRAARAKPSCTVAPSITSALVRPSEAKRSTSCLVLASASSARSHTTISPLAAFADRACLSASARTFLGSSWAWLTASRGRTPGHHRGTAERGRSRGGPSPCPSACTSSCRCGRCPHGPWSRASRRAAWRAGSGPCGRSDPAAARGRRWLVGQLDRAGRRRRQGRSCRVSSAQASGCWSGRGFGRSRRRGAGAELAGHRQILGGRSSSPRRGP